MHDGDESKRAHTDASLRFEREQYDISVETRLAGVNEAADSVIIRARARARDVLARARERAAGVTTPVAATTMQTKAEHMLADKVVLAEQVDAEASLRAELSAHVERSTPERRDTDSDLQIERVHADDVLARRDEVLGNVSHELRNMLHAVIGFAELIELDMSGKTETELKVAGQARFIQRSGARMDRLLGDLVDVASIESRMLKMTPTPSDPSSVVAEAVSAFDDQAAASGISLSGAVANSVSSALFDTERVLQVLVNLLSNALKFTPKNGKVSVSVHRVDEELRFAVSDTGIGIATDKLENIFDRFWQASEGDRRGSGLGLYISKSIVLAHGGRLWVESKLGEGSTFFFTLPCLPEAPER
jgi:signal transduction histidine kinase